MGQMARTVTGDMIMSQSSKSMQTQKALDSYDTGSRTGYKRIILRERDVKRQVITKKDHRRRFAVVDNERK